MAALLLLAMIFRTFSQCGYAPADLEHQSEEQGKEGDGSDAASEDHELSAI